MARPRRNPDPEPSGEGAPGAAPPAFVPPCISITAERVPAGESWLHEFKWDGYRLMARVEAGRATLLTRNGFDWTERFPTIARAAAALPVLSAYLDGEAIVEERGVPDFTALRRALGEGRGDKAIMIAFDLLFLDGEDLRRLPLCDRKARLAALMERAGRGPIVYSEHAEGHGAFMMRQAAALGLEGVVAKRADRPYLSGESRDWLKVKRINRQEFVVAGYLEPKRTGQAVSSLVLGWYEEGALVYRGRVGVGFDAASAREIWWRLQALRRTDPPFAAGQPGGGAKVATWVEPRLVVEVAYGHWTPGGLLRHAVFKGLREDKEPEQVGRPKVLEGEGEASTSPSLEGEVAGAKRVTEGDHSSPQNTRPHPGSRPLRDSALPSREGEGARLRDCRPKLGVPRDNILQLLPDAVVPPKDELERYWRTVETGALEHLGRRPLKLVMHRHGTTYFHMGPLPPVPDSVHQLRIRKREGGEGVRLWIDDLAGLLGLVEMGAVELHPWGATVDDIEHPDTLVLDLDPGEGLAWKTVTDTALQLRDMLKAEGLPSWPKTSGGKGLHVMVPVDRSLTADQGRIFARDLVSRLAAKEPDLYTLASDPAEREGRIFLDYLRNGRGTTAIGAWSPRARPGFPIARPVTWAEVARAVAPDAFTMAAPGRMPRPRR